MSRYRRTVVPLTRRPGGVQAYKMVIPVPRETGPRQPDLKVHEGYEWMYVLNGKPRLVLGDQELVLLPGEAAEFDTRVPHWFGCACDDGAECEPVEFLRLFGQQGERAHLRVRPQATEA